MAPSDYKAVAALGRPFTLGMLYDARRDELVPGVALWDEETVQKHTVGSSQHSSSFEISASDSTEAKSALLDVEASLKLSFMGGLIQAGGSAKYLNDQKKFHNQSRVTLQYNATTNLKQLMANLGTKSIQPNEIINKGLATHVVTGILYGANAFFVFDSEKLDNSSVQDVQGKMEAVIKKIPSVSIEGSAELKLTDEEKKLINTFSCKFHGDFILDKNPATFTDAVDAYVRLPKLMGENAVPLKVWLMPLEDLDFRPVLQLTQSLEIPAVSGISVGLTRKIENVLDYLNQVVARCNESLEEDVVKQFPQMNEVMSSFKKLCNYYRSALKTILAEKLPLIREGKEDESALEKVFEDSAASPFSHGNLSKWLDNKEREISIMRSCMETMKGAKVVSDQSALDREVLTPGVEHALCFVFTSVESTDSYLIQLGDYVGKFHLEQVEPVHAVIPHSQWYYSDEVLTNMRGKAKAFQDVAEPLKNSSRVRFLITAIENEKYIGATVYHYKEGVLQSEEFSKPDIPDVEKVTDRREFIWYSCDLSLDPNTANYHLILSDDNKKVTYGEAQSYPDTPERFDKCRQVLCREGLTGRHYWEVEWSDCFVEHVGVGVVYKEIGRKGDGKDVQLGYNASSWYLGHWAWPTKDGYSRGFTAWYNKVESYKPPVVSTAGMKRVGVYLNWPAGTLSFYRVSSNTLTHLHTFSNEFSDAVFPAFWVALPANYAALCPVE